MNSETGENILTDNKNRTNANVSTSDTDGPTNLDDIQVILSDQTEKDKPIDSATGGSSEELEAHSSRPVNYVADASVRGGASGVRRRRIGVVEASDMAIAARRKTRVLRKKLGEDLVAEMPETLVKKL